MRQCNVAIIGGTAGFGKARLAAVAANPRAAVRAVCARHAEQVQATASAHGATAYTDWRACVADPQVEAVIIAVPNTLHAEIAAAALEAGKHVLVEYPICQTMTELDALEHLADTRGLVLHHALTVRGEGLHRRLKELAPQIGTIRHAHYRYFGGAGWYLDTALRGNLFLALHSHFIDQFEDMLGPTQRLNATISVDEEGRRVSAAVLQEFAGGTTAFQEFGMGFPAGPSYHGWYMGDDGWLGFEGFKTVNLAIGDRPVATFAPREGDVIAEDTANFLEQIGDRAAAWVTRAQTRRTMRLCLLAAESARTGRKLDVAF